VWSCLRHCETVKPRFSRCVTDIQTTFGKQCVPFQLTVGDAENFTKVISVVNPPNDVPAELAGELEAARERLIEAAAETDDTLADKYLEGEELTHSEIEDAVRSAIWEGDLVPILATSATKGIGIGEFLDMVCRLLPAPVDGVKPELSDAVKKAPIELEVSAAGPLAAFVFKTSADPFVGKLSIFRVYQGTIKSNSEVWNSVREQSERIGQLYLPKGKSQEKF